MSNIVPESLIQALESAAKAADQYVNALMISRAPPARPALKVAAEALICFLDAQVNGHLVPAGLLHQLRQDVADPNNSRTLKTVVRNLADAARKQFPNSKGREGQAALKLERLTPKC